jgi:hypothetical protein
MKMHVWNVLSSLMRSPSTCLVRWTGTIAEFGGVRINTRLWNVNAILPNWMCGVPEIRFCNWTILFRGSHNNRSIVHEHAANLCNHTIPQRYFFQQDGAPPHYANTVKAFLNQQFQGKWIGRRGPITWPPRSPDLTPLHFFQWGYIKDLVYQTKVQDVVELYRQITAAYETVTPVMLQNTWWKLEYRLDICRATKGAHVEIYWGMPKVSESLPPSVKFPCIYLS